MQKITLAALSLVLALPSFANPVKPASKPATKTNSKPSTSTSAAKPKPAAASSSTTKPTAAQPAAKPVLLSKTIVPDGKTPVANVKTTPVPDVSPTSRGQYVVINIPQQRLFLYQNGALQKVYPVAVGKAVTQTNLGEHKIGGKAFDPTWHIPKSIQAELKDGRTTVPPGPENPLGPVFVRLGNPKLGLGIHGTNAPSSVPGVRSHGCVRMKSEQAMDFANTINTGADAIVSYEMATLNVDGKNQLWLTAYKDPYSKNNLNVDALKKSIQAWASDNKITISDARVNAILKARKAVPVCISCSPKTKNVVSGSLMSVAWNSGTSALTAPKGLSMAVPPMLEEDNLDEIEVEADVSKGKTLQPVATTPAKVSTKPAASSKAKTSSTSKAAAAPASETVGEKPLLPENTSASTTKPVATKPATTKTTTSSKSAVAPKANSTAASAPAAAPKLKTDKLKVQSTSVFDESGAGEVPLHPVAPMNATPTDSGR